MSHNHAGNAARQPFWFAGALPTVITDDFASDSGDWLDGALAAAAMSIGGGRGYWTPGAGSPILDEAWDNWSGDNPVGWNVMGETASMEMSEVGSGEGHGGSGTNALNVWRNAASGSVSAWKYGVLTTDIVYRIATQVSYKSGGAPYIDVSSTPQRFHIFNTGAALGTKRSAGTHAAIYATVNTDATLDDLILTPLTESTLWRVQPIYYASLVQVKALLNAQGKVHQGVVLFRDVNNYVLAVWDSYPTLRLYKRVSGTLSAPLASQYMGAASADKVLTLTPNAAFDAFSVSYDGTEYFSDISITDFAPFAGQWHAGLYCADQSETFDDFKAEAVS